MFNAVSLQAGQNFFSLPTVIGNMKKLGEHLQAGTIKRCALNAHLSKLADPKAPDWSATKAAVRDCKLLCTWYTLCSAEITDMLLSANTLLNDSDDASEEPYRSMEKYRLQLVAYGMSLKVNLTSLETHIAGMEVMIYNDGMKTFYFRLHSTLI
jgi:hypothetical protein